MRLPLTLLLPPLLLLAQQPDSSAALPAEELWLKITATGSRRRLSLVVADFTPAPDSSAAEQAPLDTLKAVLESDLSFSLHFVLQQPDSGITFDFSTDPRSVDLEGWASTGAEVLVCGALVRKASGPVIDLQLYDLATVRRIAAKSYALGGRLRWLAHEMADDIIKLLTGEDGVSRTRIAFSQATDQGQKELAAVDHDGADLGQLTGSGGVKLFPDWSPDGTRIAYCAYGDRSLNVLTLQLADGSVRTLIDRPGLNTTPAWSPDGRSLAVSLSYEGQSDIYVVNADGSNLRCLAHSSGIDISPCWSPTGGQIAFVSDRTGSPQVYVVDRDGTDLRRLTYEGSYNTSPAWSGRGDMIAFVQRQPGGANQICVTDIMGDTYVRLTSRGNNEDPCWSPDGLHLAFSSNRSGSYEIYTMDWSGANQTRVTAAGGATSPSWSPVIPAPGAR